MVVVNKEDDFINGRLKILKSINDINGFPSWIIYLEKRGDHVQYGKLIYMPEINQYFVQLGEFAEDVLRKEELEYIHKVKRELGKKVVLPIHHFS